MYGAVPSVSKNGKMVLRMLERAFARLVVTVAVFFTSHSSQT
jgi:hypothetical protein